MKVCYGGIRGPLGERGEIKGEINMEEERKEDPRNSSLRSAWVKKEEGRVCTDKKERKDELG